MSRSQLFGYPPPISMSSSCNLNHPSSEQPRPFTPQSSLSTPPSSNPPTATSVLDHGVLSSPLLPLPAPRGQCLGSPSSSKACAGQTPSRKRTRSQFSDPSEDDPLQACVVQKRTRLESPNPSQNHSILLDRPNKKAKVLLTTVRAEFMTRSGRLLTSC